MLHLLWSLMEPRGHKTTLADSLYPVVVAKIGKNNELIFVFHSFFIQ